MLTVFTLLGFSIALILFSNTKYANIVRAEALDFLKPAIETVQLPIESVRTWWDDKEQYFALKQKNKLLEEENKNLRRLQVELVAIKTENQYLRKTLNVPASDHANYITAKVLAKPLDIGSETFLLAAGSQQNVYEGAPVLSKDGVVGRVTWVSKKTSRVINVADRSFRLPVKKENTDDHFIFSGDGKNALYILHTQGDSALNAGETLVTSGRDGVFPPGIFVGRAKKSKMGNFYLTPAANLKKTEYVRILLPEKRMPKQK